MKGKSKSGISLIVLVITIIVIIILAVAVILSISNNNPIENARKARFLNDLKTIQEEVTLHIGTQYANDPENYNPSTDTGIQGIVNKYTDYSEKIQVVDGKVVLVNDETKVSDQERQWASEVGITVQEKIAEPVIPVGFVHTEGTVDDGYVIQNETDGNEFVWVPVEDFSTFERESFGYTGDFTEPYTGDDADPSEKIEFDAMRDSVRKYKGFYIARYEASDNGSGIAQSKKGQSSWDIKFGNSTADLSGGAVEKSRDLYPNSDKVEDSKYAVSTLCYGVQWDATIRWLKKNYPTITEDSSDWGNYNTSSAIPTGSNDSYKTNNIYDMCGNVYEWTMENGSYGDRVIRGGVYESPGNISDRVSFAPDSVWGVGFRIALYIK